MPSVLQGIFLTQGLNSGPPCCRRVLYQLSYHGGPFLWVDLMIDWLRYSLHTLKFIYFKNMSLFLFFGFCVQHVKS